MKDLINSILKDRKTSFIVGIIMLTAGLWFFVQNVYVSSGRFSTGFQIGPFTIRSGVFVLPLLGSLVWMFFRPGKKAPKIFAGAGLALIVIYTVLTVNIRVGRVPIVKWIGILFLIVLGAVFTLSSLGKKQVQIK